MPKDFQVALTTTDNHLPSFEKFIENDLWEAKRTLRQIKDTNFSPLFNDDLRNGFHYPATVKIDAWRIPAFIFSHHYAHVAYAFYSSPYESAAIMTNDGAGGSDQKYMCGLFAYGNKNKLYAYSPNTLIAGDIYATAARRMGLDPGKMMGLSSYGKPRFYSDKFIGNWYDCGQIWPQEWIDHALREAEILKDMTSPNLAMSTPSLMRLMPILLQALKSCVKRSCYSLPTASTKVLETVVSRPTICAFLVGWL